MEINAESLSQHRCEAHSESLYYQSFRMPRLVPRAFSTDGTCGPKSGGTICDPNSATYKVIRPKQLIQTECEF